MKYTKKMVFDYVSGAEISEELLEKLENDEKFMIEVIKHSKDLKLYHYCSEKVKQSTELILFLIDEFSSKVDFLIEAAEYCLSNEQLDEISRAEIQIKLAELYDKTKNKKLMQYKMEANSVVVYKQMQISAFLSQPENEDLQESHGLGFAFAELDYSGSKIVLDYMAKSFINEYIFTEYITLEDILHGYFENIEELEKITDTEFLLTHIRNLDFALANYLARNKELLDPLKKEVAKAKRNWNAYINHVNFNKVNIVEDEYEEYIDKKMLLCDTRRTVIRIIKKLGLQDVFEEHSILFNSRDDIVDEDDEFYEYEKVYEELSEQYTMEDLAFIKHMTEFIRSTFSKATISLESPKEESDEEKEQDKPKSKSRVIRFDFNNKIEKKDE